MARDIAMGLWLYVIDGFIAGFTAGKNLLWMAFYCERANYWAKIYRR